MTRQRRRHAALVAVAAATWLGASPQSVHAHPHIWVEVKTTIVYERGSFTGIRQSWTFDELYSSRAIEGLDKNGDGRLDREELSELAKINMEGLKEFDYFTFPRLGGQPIALGDPSEAYLEHIEVTHPPGASPLQTGTVSADAAKPAEPPGFWARVWASILGQPVKTAQKPRVLQLVFQVPLKQPVLAEADGFDVSTYDPSFFIWFEPEKGGGIAFSQGAPAGCSLTVREGDKSAADAQRLGEAFFNQMGGAGFGASVAKTVVARCKTS